MMWCSRFRKYKREADSDALWLRKNGGYRVSVTGKRGGPWRVRANIDVAKFARFCALEAEREAKK